VTNYPDVNLDLSQFTVITGVRFDSDLGKSQDIDYIKNNIVCLAQYSPTVAMSKTEKYSDYDSTG